MKPQNILIDVDGVVKLCDFGFARAMNANSMVLTSIKVSNFEANSFSNRVHPYIWRLNLLKRSHMIIQLTSGIRCDMFFNVLRALGCILYELYMGTPPFYTDNIIKLVKMITDMNIKWSSSMSREFRSFLEGLLEKDVRMRLQWPALLDHPFVCDGIRGEWRSLIRLHSTFTLYLKIITNYFMIYRC